MLTFTFDFNKMANALMRQLAGCIPEIADGAGRDLFSLLTPAPLHLLNAKNLKTLQKVPDEQGKLNFDLLNCQKKQCSRWDGQRFIFTSCT